MAKHEFGIMLAILLIFKNFLGIERSVLPYACGAAIGWCIGRRIIEMYFSKKKSR